MTPAPAGPAPGRRVRSVRRVLATATAAGLLLGGALGGAPVAAAAPGQVAGSTDPAAAEPLPLGDSTTTLGNARDRIDRNRYFRANRTTPSGRLIVGAVMQPPGMAHDGFSIQTSRAQNRTCLHNSNFGPSRGGAVIGVSGDALDGCPPEPGMLVQVQRADLTDMPRNNEPAPALVRVLEVPEVRNLNDLPATLPPPKTQELPTGEQGRVTPGTLTAPASIQSTRSYRLSLDSGTVHVFSVPVDWGQWLQVQAQIAPSEAVAAVSDQRPQFGIGVLGPDLGEAEETVSTLTGDADTFDAVTEPVALRAYSRSGSKPFLAGRYLVALWLSPDRLAGPLRVDYTLTTRVGGEVTGVPDFGGEQIRGVDSGQLPLRRWIALGVGGLGGGLLVAAGAVWLVSRRRTPVG
ncbi:hypothetical protein HJ590_10905 [Naumannella sp. ID2617S]|nr:hypothetical protein [Naumannella sp. ID2617S]